MTLTWSEVLGTLLAGRDLDTDTVHWAMNAILTGEATDAQVAGFLVALRAKGETSAEVRALVDALYAKSVELPIPGRVVDIVGTGGDLARTVNISSMAAVATAGAGVPVVKHGNRAASSQTGTADVYQQLGIRLDVPAESIPHIFEAAGITFCFAQIFHPSMRFAGGPRRELGIPTVFNILGPLANPARAQAMAVGCADPKMAPLMASVLADREVDALVFRGNDGLDEITVCDTTQVWVVSGGEVEGETFDPRDVGIDLAPAQSLRGGDPAFNADVFRRVLDAEKSPVRDAVVLNAGAAIAVYANESGQLADRIGSGIQQAVESIDSGAARKVLENWAGLTQRFAAT